MVLRPEHRVCLLSIALILVWGCADQVDGRWEFGEPDNQEEPSDPDTAPT